ncbi:MAG: tail fiber domain-containing protein, partial [Thermoanaerobaculales bacterium]
ESTMLGYTDRWTANSAVIPAGNDPKGSINVFVQYAGDVIIEVNGYYGPQGVVTSLTGGVAKLTGDVTLAAGSNIDISPSSNTLTISMTGVSGGTLPAGTSGQTLRSNGSGWLANSFLYNDGSKIGINTPSPAQTLDVNGTMRMPMTTATSGTPTAGVLFLGTDRFIHNYGAPGSDGENTFVGLRAGNFTMGSGAPFDGIQNTGIGKESLTSNTTGCCNAALGVWSLHNNTTGYMNTVIGYDCLYYNTTGNYNTAVGAGALRAQAFDNGGAEWDSSNTAVGVGTLYNNNPTATTNGIDNTAVGRSSLYSNTIGADNTSVGVRNLAHNTTASKNVAVGAYALNTQSFDNGGTMWDSFNTAIGYNALYTNQPDSTGDGFENTAVGAYALYSNATGAGNTATGLSALGANTTGSDNTATGASALQANTTGSENTAIGVWALQANTTGTSNTAIGSESMNLSSTGSYNVASGVGSLRQNKGNYNTATGESSLYNNSTGESNTAVGQDSLDNNTTGSANIALGWIAGSNLTTGSHNIDIGNVGVAGEGNTIRLGTIYNAAGGWGQNATYIAGINGANVGTGSAVYVNVDGRLGTIASSLRFKQDVTDMGDASSRLMELRPVTFHYKSQPDGPLQYGLIAEEVEDVMPELVVRDATGQVESVAYHELPAMLLNELQKQRATIEAQQTQIESRDARIASLENQHAVQQTQIETLAARLAAIEARLAAK